MCRDCSQAGSGHPHFLDPVIQDSDPIFPDKRLSNEFPAFGEPQILRLSKPLPWALWNLPVLPFDCRKTCQAAARQKPTKQHFQ